MRASVLVCLAACGESGWDALRNPIASFDDVAVKDAFLVRSGDTWHFGYSEISDDPFRFRLGFATTNDLRGITRGESLDQPETGGLASPSVTLAPDGRYVMTYNSHTRDVGETANKLYVRTSSDLIAWSDPQRLHIDGADGDDERLIDATIAFTDDGAYLVFKRGQLAHVAHAPGLDGPWTLLGPISPRTVENGQLIQIDGTWHLLATTVPLHAPTLYRLGADWTQWNEVGELAIPAQPWNDGDLLQHERANAAFLVDDRAVDGSFYVIYAGSTEVESFEGRGHARLGIARSSDLITWEAATSR